MKTIAYLVPDYHEPYNGANPVYPKLTFELEVAEYWAKIGKSSVVKLIATEILEWQTDSIRERYGIAD